MNDSTEQGGTGDGFQDPTAPTWSTPEATQPLPTPEPPVAPPSPYASPQPYDSPAAPAPYGQAPDGQPPYGQAPYGQPPYAVPPGPYAPPQKNTSAIVLTVVSAVALISCCNVFAIAPLVLGIMGLSRAATDPQGAARSTKAGWITFAVTTALVVIGWVVFLALAGFGAFEGSTTYEYEGL